MKRMFEPDPRKRIRIDEVWSVVDSLKMTKERQSSFSGSGEQGFNITNMMSNFKNFNVPLLNF